MPILLPSKACKTQRAGGNLVVVLCGTLGYANVNLVVEKVRKMGGVTKTEFTVVYLLQ